MGNSICKGKDSSPPAVKNEVDAQLAEAQEQDKFVHKILLLGAGECGKSTVVKQLKMIWKTGSFDKEKLAIISPLRRNCIEAIQILLEASRTLKIPLGDPNLQVTFDGIIALESHVTLTEDMAVAIDKLWNDSGIKATFERRAEYWNMDSTPYYLNEVLRIADPDFDPNEEDVIMTRVRTTGIVVTEIVDHPYTYQVVDVGGQRSERRKWIHCFEDVRAIIFLEGLPGYNQVLFEDNSVNRMKESMALFEDIIKNPIFSKTPIFIYLNKKDLFEEMIPKYPLKVCFPEYTGPEGEVAPALEFISAKYRQIMDQYFPGKPLYISVIAARVRMDMKIAFTDVKNQLKQLFPPGNVSPRKQGNVSPRKQESAKSPTSQSPRK